MHTEDLDAWTFIEKYESNARTYARTFNRVMARGSIAKLWDVDGKEYLDFIACAGALPLGHNHPFVMEKVQQFLESGHIQQALDISTVAKLEFMQQLLQTLPAPFRDDVKIQFCGPSGSDAVEAALKLFKVATGRRSVLTFHGGYHGMTSGSLSLMGNLNPKSAVTGLSPETHFFPYPHSTRCPFGVGGEEGETLSLNYLESMLADAESGITKPAMVILEAVQGEGGCIPAPAAWLRRLRAITRAYDIPLVIDEVQTGFGRTGHMFAHEIAGIEPDAIILSKALGGGFPLAVVAYNKRYDTWQPGTHAGTFRGNQIAMVAGAATMQFIREQDLVSQARDKGAYLLAQLQSLAVRTPCMGEVRGRGLMLGVEIVAEEGPAPRRLDGALAKLIKQECFHRGLIVETGGRHGGVLRLLPPLLVSMEEMAAAVLILEQAIVHVTQTDNLQLAA